MCGRVTARITLAEFVDEVYWPQKAGLRANTRQGYERDLRRRILPALGNMELEQINKLDVQRMLSARPTRKTATNARETLSSVLGCAVEMGMLSVNPASFRYTYPGDVADPERRGEWLTTFGDHERLLGYLRETWPGSCVERICMIGLCKGLCKGEVLALRWADVDLARRELTVRGAYTQGLGGAHETDPKNRNARRTIPLRAYAAERMCRFTAGSYPDGTPLPRVTMASLRHSFATACVNEDMEVSKFSRIMGRADIKTTMCYYVRQKLDDLKVAVDAMDGWDVGKCWQ